MKNNKPYKINPDKLADIGILLLFMLLSFLFALKSPLNIWQNGDAGTDSSVFKYVAFLMGKGYMPYRDTFDHKGPLLYIINLLGNSISYYRGIWLFELITIFITLLFLYKIARLCGGRFVSITAALLSISLLFEFFNEGNFTEEYAMPFLAVSLFLYIDYFKNRTITKFRLAVCGFCFGAVCMLRPNMISVWIVFSISVLILCIKEKRFLELGQFICYFSIGFCILVLPIMVWLIANNSFPAFFDDYIRFNLVYSSAAGGRASFPAKWSSFFYFLNKTVVLFAVIISICLSITKDRFLYGTYTVYLFLTLLLICISGQLYAHYGMVLVPAVAFPIASFLGILETDLKQSKNHAAFFIVVYLLLSTIVLPNWLAHLGGVGNLYANRQEYHRSALVDEVCNYIQLNTTDDEKISVYGNWDIIYVLSQRVSASKYSYQFPIGTVIPSIMDEYFRELEESLPKLIVVQEGRRKERIVNFLNNNGYAEVWLGGENGPFLYERGE